MALDRVVKTLDAALDAFILLICALILLISVYSLVDNFMQYNDSADVSTMPYKPSDNEPISDERRITENQVAWLTIYDTDIDYPVMQGMDNSEYLNKDPYGDFSLAGSIFLDYRNDKGLNDEYSIIYGHHLDYGIMFGSLDKFMDSSYFNEHRKGRVHTGSSVYDLELFAVASSDGGNQTLFSPEGRTISEVTAFLQGNASIYCEPEAGHRIVALSTCAGDDYFARLLVFGYLTEQ